MSDLISIIVPVYNAEKTLERCVRALIGQTYQNIEIILVNDGSKDDSLRICRNFAGKDSRVTVIDKPNGGVSSARNAGLEIVHGEFVMFCDSDDWVEPDWCDGMIANYIPGDLTVCEIARDDIGNQEAEIENDLVVEIAERRDFLHYPMLMCSPVNKIFARGIIEKNKLRFPEELSLGEDFSFVLAYLCGIDGKVRFINRKLYYYDVTTVESLSKQSPTLEQCDHFYWLVTSPMEKLGAKDKESLMARDTLVMSHFERLLIATSLRKDISIWEKMAVAGEVRSLESFCSSSCRGMKWGNPFYLWLYRKKYVKLIMVFLLLRSYKERLCTLIGKR